jgi:anaerobic magnesium-protoporphyrin IX monomethyl ester cyclase
MSRVLLISYPGYPSTPAALVANPWLANVPGLLLAAGHAALAQDFGTVTVMRRLYPEAITKQLTATAAGMAGSGGGDPDEAQLRVLRQVSDAVDAHQAQVEGQLAEEVVALARAWQPDLVALELSDAGGYEGTIAMARRLRAEFPALHLTVSGRKATWFRELLLEVNPELDSVVVGDPEGVILALAERRAVAGQQYRVRGLVERGEARPVGDSDGDLDLDSLPTPSYDPETYPAMAGDEKIRIIIVTDSRGCPNRCGFCVHPYEDGGTLRAASPGRVVDTMAALQERHGFSVFRLAGASTPNDLLRGIAQEILGRDLQVQYHSFGHFRGAEPEGFATLARSGLHSVFYGLESGSQEILDRACHKGVKLAHVGEVVRAARAAGIFTAASMVVPLPFDTPETLAESLRFVTELQPDAVPLQFPGLFPGTRWMEHPERYNIEVAGVREYLLASLGYRFKLLFPPQDWEPLPYRVNGLEFREFVAIAGRFARDLEAAGILTHFSHTLASLAHAAEVPPRQLRDLARLWCMTGDAEAMGAMVTRANRNLLCPPAR